MRRIAQDMHRLYALVLFAFTVFAVFAAPSVAHAETPTGAAYIVTLPSAADIWLDGTYVGRAPVFVDALLPGHHSVTVTKAGWVTQVVDVMVGPSATAVSTTRLVAGSRALAGAASGSVVVRAAPPGSALVLDGTPLGRPMGQPFSLGAGSHRIAITTPRGTSTRAFTVLPDTVTDIVLAQPAQDARHSAAVVAPADDYLPDGSVVVEGKKIVVRFAGHVAVTHYGESTARVDGAHLAFDGAAESIDGRLYLPLELLEKLTATTSKVP